MKSFIEALTKNLVFALEFLGIAVAIFIVAYVAEKLIRKKQNIEGKFFTARNMATIAMLSAIGAVLNIFDFPLFFVPSFYKFDISDLPALIGCFAYGPLAGVLIQFLKVLIKLLIKGTTTAFAGDFANFTIGAVFVLTASFIYMVKKNKKSAIWACIIATIVRTAFGCFLNAVYLIPTFSVMFGMPMEGIIAMGTKICKKITDLPSFVALAVAPINLLKSIVCSLITILTYKKLRKIIH